MNTSMSVHTTKLREYLFTTNGWISSPYKCPDPWCQLCYPRQFHCEWLSYTEYKPIKKETKMVKYYQLLIDTPTLKSGAILSNVYDEKIYYRPVSDLWDVSEKHDDGDRAFHRSTIGNAPESFSRIYKIKNAQGVEEYVDQATALEQAKLKVKKA